MSEVKYLKDYVAPDFLITDIDLTFHLQQNATKVVNRMQVVRQGTDATPLVLDGVGLQLLSVTLDGNDVDVVADDEHLTVAAVPDQFELEVITEIDPQANSSLEGLYLSDGAFCTQCEAEGFRKITYSLDRPDVLSRYRVTIHADKQQFPYLLSNGNKVGQGEGDNGTHFATWQDPHPKPSYLFALVAGDFDKLTSSFTTQSGRPVALELFVDKGNLDKGQHALDSLRKAMLWDEHRFGLEYDLDVYMVVAVDFFNMGAMENKGLNVFNSKYVLANAQTATDEDFFNIESVIGHEYFHNWTGNRVTCRDWFQLSLKEGLTVFRDQEFSADMASPGVVRIDSVQTIREHQFAEDGGPMAHPIRPEAVMEMNNFYTVTVYNKGAEVIRMLQTLLSKAGFEKGLRLYFERHDGQAVTCDDFVQAMADANNKDLSQFKRWYSQSGTPELQARSSWDEASGKLSVVLTQQTKPTADQIEKQALHMPIAIEFIGDDCPQPAVLELVEEQQTFEFDGFAQKPIVSLLGGFSAPVKLTQHHSDEELHSILLGAKDDVARWDASQLIYSNHLHQLAEAIYTGSEKPSSDHVIETIDEVLGVGNDDKAMLAMLLSLPNFDTLAQQKQSIDVDSLLDATALLESRIAEALKDKWLALADGTTANAYVYETKAAGQRRLKKIALYYLGMTKNAGELLTTQFNQANNMTDTLGALKAAQAGNLQVFDQLMSSFEAKWRNEPLVMDKWFSLHATTDRSDILSRIELLMSHGAYSISNPNRVRSLVGSFAFYNHRGFHRADCSGYKMLTDYLMKLDKVNPQVSSRLITPLIQYQKLDAKRKQHIRSQLMRLADIPALSKDLFEKISKSLAMEE